MRSILRPLAFWSFWLMLLTTEAWGQIQPGPNLSPSGVPFTFSPRFGYLGPPAAFVPVPPPPARYYRPGSMPMLAYPRPHLYPRFEPPMPPAVAPPAGPPPTPRLRPPAVEIPRDPKEPALPRPRGSHPPIPPPCPDGCPRIDPTKGQDI
jgi:hypothetical protein